MVATTDSSGAIPPCEFGCVTFKPEGAEVQRHHGKRKNAMRAHHVRVGRYFNLLDFCRSGRAVEHGIDLVPKGAENDGGRGYIPVREEVAARSFAAALDPMVEQLGRISVVRGIETEVFQARFPDVGHAKLHRWDREDGPWRLVFVLPKGANPETACSLLRNCPHVHQDVRSFPHAVGVQCRSAGCRPEGLRRTPRAASLLSDYLTVGIRPLPAP